MADCYSDHAVDRADSDVSIGGSSLSTSECPSYTDYLGVIMGSTVMAISEEEHTVCFHMSGGHSMEITAAPSGGFSITVVLPEERH